MSVLVFKVSLSIHIPAEICPFALALIKYIKIQKRDVYIFKPTD